MKNSAEPSPSTRSLSGNGTPLTLWLRGSHIQAFKNRKRICGKALITKPEVKEAMDRYQASLESQLLAACPTGEIGTWTGPLAQSLTALFERSPQFDDNWKCVAELTVRPRVVAKGDEGADIEITLLP